MEKVGKTTKNKRKKDEILQGQGEESDDQQPP